MNKYRHVFTTSLIFIFLFLSLFSFEDLFKIHQNIINLSERIIRPNNNSILITKEMIEEAVEANGGWDAGYTQQSWVPKGIITELNGIKLKKPLLVAKKKQRDHSDQAFYKNIIASLLDELFIKLTPEEIALDIVGITKQDPLYEWKMNRGEYNYSFPHVPKVITLNDNASIPDTGYYYVYFQGREPKSFDQLQEWRLFSSLFSSHAGIQVTGDEEDFNEGKPKNIILSLNEKPFYWQRIDYDERSMPMTRTDGTKLKIDDFLSEHALYLQQKMKDWKYELLLLATQLIQKHSVISDINITEGQFAELFRRYQQEVLQEYLP